MVEIVMDTREDRNTDYRIVFESLGYKVKVMQMGPDYLVPELGWAIERKADDFWPSVQGGKLKSQLKELTDLNWEETILAIDSPDPKKYIEQMGIEQFFGTLGSVEQHSGTTIAFTFGYLPYWLNRRIIKATDGKVNKVDIIRKRMWKKRAHTIVEQRAHVLAQLPGVSYETAYRWAQDHKLLDGMKEILALKKSEL